MPRRIQDEDNLPARKFLIGFGVLLFLLAVLTFGFKKALDHTGAREWEDTRAMLIREEVELDLEKLLPEIPPDAENFAATPMIATLLWNYPEVEEKKMLNERFREMRIPRRSSVDLPDQKTGLPEFFSQRETDFNEIALALVEAGDIPSSDSTSPAPAIRNWMEQFRPEIETLDNASLRPLAVWPEPPLFDYFSYNEGLNDYVDDLTVHLKFQAARAAAFLVAGDEEEAISAVRTMFQICGTLSSQPFIIPQLASLGCETIIFSLIWEGIEKQRWSADGLDQIAEFLSRYPADSLERFEKTMNVSLIVDSIGFPDYMASLSFRERHQNATAVHIMDGSNTLPCLAALAISPRGFLDHNKSFSCLLHYETAIRPARLRDPHSARIDLEEALSEISIQNFFPRLYLNANRGIHERFFEAVNIQNMAKAAVAVERFQKAEGRYPTDLNELVPRYLTEVPADLQTKEKGKTLNYRIENDRPLIYSVGRNQSDENGEIVWREYSAEKKADRKEGDWVWGYQ